MKITKEELANIIKEEVEKALSEQEDLSAYLAGLGIPLDKNGNPTKRPPLPKNWRSLPPSDVKRQAFRMWYTEYGPGSKRKKAAAKAKPAAKPAAKKVQSIEYEPQVIKGTSSDQYYNRAAEAEAKGYYRVAKRLYRKASELGHKSPTSGKDIATAKAKEMDALVKKGRGLGKGTDFDKSRSKSKTNPERRDKKKAKKVKTFDPKKGFVDDDGETAKQYKNLKKPNQKDTNPLAKYPAVDKKASAKPKKAAAKAVPRAVADAGRMSEQEWLDKYHYSKPGKFYSTSAAKRTYKSAKNQYETGNPLGIKTPGVYKKSIGKK
jgi:hypothetical protein